MPYLTLPNFACSVACTAVSKRLRRLVHDIVDYRCFKLSSVRAQARRRHPDIFKFVLDVEPLRGSYRVPAKAVLLEFEARGELSELLGERWHRLGCHTSAWMQPNILPLPYAFPPAQMRFGGRQKRGATEACTA